MAGNPITIKSIMEEQRGNSRDRNYGKDEHPAIQDEVARGKGKDSNEEMEFTDDDTEMEKGQRCIRKKGKSNKITLTPNRPRVQVTTNEKTAGGGIQDPPQKGRYNKGQLEAFFGPGMRKNCPGQAERTINKDRKGGKIGRRLQQKGKIGGRVFGGGQREREGFCSQPGSNGHSPEREEKLVRHNYEIGAQDSQDSQQRCLNKIEEREESYVCGSNIGPLTTEGH
jgi:hypothetical protein